MSCSAYKFDEETKSCVLGSKLPLVEAQSDPQDGTVIQVNINSADPWHLIAGGFDGSVLSDVELFDWQKGYTCTFSKCYYGCY